MLVLDTNVVLRLLLRDDPEQEEKVRLRLKKLERSGEQVLLTPVVLLECLWILQYRKALPRALVVELLEGLLSVEAIKIEGAPRLRRALQLYAEHEVDFVDAYLAGVGEEPGHDGVLSFDKDIGKMGVKWVRP
jgi:predicted nucleic-acid-binding protein